MDRSVFPALLGCDSLAIELTEQPPVCFLSGFACSGRFVYTEPYVTWPFVAGFFRSASCRGARPEYRVIYNQFYVHLSLRHEFFTFLPGHRKKFRPSRCSVCDRFLVVLLQHRLSVFVFPKLDHTIRINFFS